MVVPSLPRISPLRWRMAALSNRPLFTSSLPRKMFSSTVRSLHRVKLLVDHGHSIGLSRPNTVIDHWPAVAQQLLSLW